MIAAHVDEPYFPEPLIRQAANRVIKAYRLSVSDLPDIEQHIRMRITQGWRRYSPQLSQPNTYADRLVKAATATHVRDRTRQKRDPRREAGSFADLEIHPSTTEADHERWVVSMDFNLAIEKLDPADRDFARAMMHAPPLAAARKVGLTRRKSETAIKRIRAVFVAEGLEDYFGGDREVN